MNKLDISDSHEGTEQPKRPLEALTTVAALVAAIVSIITLAFTINLSQEANGIAKGALELAQTSAEEGIARQVYIGEVPIDYDTMDSETHVAAINANRVAVYDVTVEGELNGRDAVVNIWTIQSCTGYTLPSGFTPNAIRFFDGTRAWVRQEDGSLSEASTRHHVDEKGAADPPRTFRAVGCD